MDYIYMYLFIGLVSGITSVLLHVKAFIPEFNTKLAAQGIPVSFQKLFVGLVIFVITGIFLTTFIWPLTPIGKVWGWINNLQKNRMEKRNLGTVSELDMHMKRALKMGISNPQDMEKFLLGAMPGRKIKIKTVDLSSSELLDSNGRIDVSKVQELLGKPGSEVSQQDIARTIKADMGIIPEFQRFLKTKNQRTLWAEKHVRRARAKEMHSELQELLQKLGPPS